MPFCVTCRLLALAGLLAMPLAWADSPAAPVPSAQTAAAPPKQPKPPEYSSSLSTYQAHADPDPIAWAQANARVRQIGGWRAYAKESAPDKPDSANHHTPKSGGTH